MTPTIAIITRTRNRPQLLERTLRSILGQKRKDWQWVVVDAEGNPGTASVLTRYQEELAERVLHVRTPAELTISAMSNAGLRASESRLVTLLDDDDTWEPDFLEAMIAALEGKLHPNTAGVACHTTCVEEEADVTGHLAATKEYLHNPRLRNVSLGTVALVNQFCVHAFVFERLVLERVGYYDETLPVLDDWEFNLRFLLHYDIQFVPRALARYHLRPTAKDGPEANSQFSGRELHLHYEAKIINEAIRADAAGHGNGLGLLLGMSAGQRELLHTGRNALSRLESMSQKVGRIDQRTKVMKDALAPKKKR